MRDLVDVPPWIDEDVEVEQGASKPANAIPSAIWVIALLFGAAWMAVPLYLVG
jgi:hypothetical protein